MSRLCFDLYVYAVCHSALAVLRHMCEFKILHLTCTCRPDRRYTMPYCGGACIGEFCVTSSGIVVDSSCIIKKEGHRKQKTTNNKILRRVKNCMSACAHSMSAPSGAVPTCIRKIYRQENCWIMLAHFPIGRVCCRGAALSASFPLDSLEKAS